MSTPSSSITAAMAEELPKAELASATFVFSEAILIDCRLADRERPGILGTTGTTGMILPGCLPLDFDPELGRVRCSDCGATAEDGVVG